MNNAGSRFCPNCGADIAVGANFCEACGAQLGSPPPQQQPRQPAQEPEPSEPTPDWSPPRESSDDGPSIEVSEEKVQEAQQQSGFPEYYGHLFGDVYYDKRARYALLEVTGAILMLLPPDVFGDIFRDPLLWLLENNPRALLWVAQNYQFVGLALLVAGISARIKVNPDGAPRSPQRV